MQDPENSGYFASANGANHDAPATSPAVDDALLSHHAETAGTDAYALDEATKKAVDGVLYSDIGVATLLSRLKQSIASVKDFASFLKKRSNVEDEHAKELRRLCKITHQDIRKADSRQGTYARQFETVTTLHERMADNGLQFALNLHQMHEDLNQLAFEMEKGRKNWKQVGMSAETKAQDAERQMDKARQKYDSLAEQYDRAKTGESSGRHIGLRGVRTAEEREEELKSKVENSDKDYQSKVQYAKQQRQELTSSTRPQAVKALEDLITECDAGLTLQMQKFATFNERLLLSNGLLVSPLNESNAPQSRSMREVVMQIDNAQDFQSYIRSFGVKVRPRSGEIEYKQHPTLAPKSLASLGARQEALPQAIVGQPPAPPKDTTPPMQSGSLPVSDSGAVQAPRSSFQSPTYSAHTPDNHLSSPVSPHAPYSSLGPISGTGGYGSSNDRYDGAPPAHQGSGHGVNQAHPRPSARDDHGSPPLAGTGLSHQSQPAFGPDYGTQSASDPGFGRQAPYPTGPMGQQHYPPALASGPGPLGRPTTRDGAGRAPTRPIFGISLGELFRRDNSPVPTVVYQCIQAVDLFGLDTEGIYRVSGNQAQVLELKSQFNFAADKVDFRNPESFYHDVNNAAILLKKFLRDLPDPLLTNEHYNELIEAAKIPDDVVRRDSLHAIINALPDPNYATLRALVLHLHRVEQHSEANRMTSTTLAMIFAPTLMGPHHGPMQDASMQPKVVETILQNSLQIFDED